MIRILKSDLKRNRYVIELAPASPEPLTLPADVVLAEGVVPGREFTDHQWRRILLAAEAADAYEKVLTLLGQRAHSRTELWRKLRARKFGRRTVEATLDKAEKLGLVNDRQFAMIFVEEKLRTAGWGIRRLAGELRRRGIDANLVEDVLAEFGDELSPEAAFERALDLAQRRRHTWERIDDPRKRRDKLYRLLASRGFDMATAYRVWDSLKDA